MGLRKYFFKFYWAMHRLMAPRLRHSQSFYEDQLCANVDNHTDWLDLGCGHGILPKWSIKSELRLVNLCNSIVGIDLEESAFENHRSIKNLVKVDISGKMPFPAESFNLVTANMVVEHLEEPLSCFKEVNRLLKNGGKFIIHTPNKWGYIALFARSVPEFVRSRLIYLIEGRHESDVFKTYYRVNTEKTLSELGKKAGFDVKIKMVASLGELAMIPILLPFELLWIRLLLLRPFRNLRPNIVAVLTKPSQPS